MVTIAKRCLLEHELGALRATLVVEGDLQGRGIDTLLIDAGTEGGTGRENRGWGGRGGAWGVEHQEQRETPFAT